MTIQERADQAYGFFARDTRMNGQEFWKVKDNAPEWVRELVHEAHHDGYSYVSPDDFRYDTIVEVLASLSDTNDPDSPELEADYSVWGLAQWVGSQGRYSYCDEAIEELGPFTSTIELLQAGQLREKEEVWAAVVSFLREYDWEDED